jgi:drug/metabolite transporter (DMT)-like permease
LISIVSVIASLYPVMTVVLAHAVLGERIARVQKAGIAAALAGVAISVFGASGS